MNINGKRKEIIKITLAIIVFYISVNTANAITETQPEDTPLFTDVELGDEHYIAIKYLKENDLIHGYEDGSFKPYNEINRAESLKVLMGALSNGKEDTKAREDFHFPDVTPTDWYFSYVVDAWAVDLVEGYPDKDPKS